jgi:hypothetical protein
LYARAQLGSRIPDVVAYAEWVKRERSSVACGAAVKWLTLFVLSRGVRAFCAGAPSS